jgi:ketosteroid isomerase-like protein
MRPLALALLLVVLGCAATPPAVNVPDETAAVERVLDDWHRAAAEANEARYFGHLTEDAVFLGTDATERWDKAAFRAYAHPHFAKGKAWSFEATRRAVIFGERGDVAWFDEDLATPNLGPARGSGVLLRGSDGTWRIAHYNLTITVPNERFDAVKALLESKAPETP